MRPWLETWRIEDVDAEGDRKEVYSETATIETSPTRDPNGGLYVLQRGQNYAEYMGRVRLAVVAPALVRALLAVESASDGYCPGCGSLMINQTAHGLDGHYLSIKNVPECPIDAALTAAGLPDQASRDEARKEMEGR